MILVTGGTGFLGFHLLQQLLESKEGVPLRATFRSSSKATIREKLPAVEWVEADLLDPLALEDAMTGVQQVYHCAAVISYSPSQAEMMHQINVEGSKNLMNAALFEGIQKLIHVSSIAAIGRKPNKVQVDEDIDWDPYETSNYAKSKYEAEMEAWRAHAEGLPLAIVNPSVILGPWDWEAGSTRLFKRAWKEARFYTEGGTGFVDVEDVATAMIQLMDSDIEGERYILNAENLPYKELFDLMAKHFKKNPPSIKAGTTLSSLAWRLDSLRAKLTNSDPLLTKETAQAANKYYEFQNQKFLKAFPHFQYQPIESTIQRTCQILLKGY